MDNLKEIFPILFFVLWFVFSLLGKSKKKPPEQTGNDLPEYIPPQPSPREESRDSSQPKSKGKRSLDYMMAKPKQKQDDVYTEEVPEQIVITETMMNSSRQEPLRETVAEHMNNVYQDYLGRHKLRDFERTDEKLDAIQAGEIKSVDKKEKMRINIEKQQIMQAITYAQVLEQPKSLQYLKRFGIKRVVHKD